MMKFVNYCNDYALYHPIFWISGISREGESSPIYQTLELSVSKQTHTSLLDVLIILPQSEFLSKEIWIFSVPNVPACPMNCSQNYILHVCFHLNLKHANIRQLFLPSFHFLWRQIFFFRFLTQENIQNILISFLNLFCQLLPFFV